MSRGYAVGEIRDNPLFPSFARQMLKLDEFEKRKVKGVFAGNKARPPLLETLNLTILIFLFFFTTFQHIILHYHCPLCIVSQFLIFHAPLFNIFIAAYFSNQAKAVCDRTVDA